jgi:DNA-binding MarR family transcriptional regulator
MAGLLHEEGEVGLLVMLLRLASILNRPMRDGVADPEGLSVNELKITMALGGEGEMAGHELAEVMGMQPMNVSRALATLSDIGWVEQVHDTANRRRKPYRLSAAGWDAHKAMGPEVKAVADFLFHALNAKEKAAFASIGSKLMDRIEKWQPPRRRPHVPRP